MYRISIFKLGLILAILLITTGCFEERDILFGHEVLEWEPPNKSTNALSMEVKLEADSAENQIITLRMQYAGKHHSEDKIGTFMVDHQSSEAVEGEQFEILTGTNVIIPAGSSFSEEIEIEIIAASLENGETLNIVLVITGDGDFPPMNNYKEFNLVIVKENGA